jgi:hypothetical protein
MCLIKYEFDFRDKPYAILTRKQVSADKQLQNMSICPICKYLGADH